MADFEGWKAWSLQKMLTHACHIKPANRERPLDLPSNTDRSLPGESAKPDALLTFGMNFANPEAPIRQNAISPAQAGRRWKEDIPSNPGW